MANAADLRIRITADGAQAAGELNRVNDALRRHGQEATAAQRHAAALRGAFTGLAAATATLYAGFQAAQALVDMVKAMIDAAVATERLTKGFQAVTGSQQAASVEMAYLSEVANRMGLEVTSAGQAYLSLTAAAKGTTLQGQAARDVFEAVSLAMAKLGKSSADTQGALLAIEQMISKGKVSAEELRGQLGERLPGAFQAAANAMGVTTQELDKLLQSGEVTAEVMLPKLAAELNRLYDDGREVSGLTAEWNRFTNAMADAGTAIANNTGLVNLLMAALQGAANKAQTLANWLNGEGWNNFASQVDRGNYLLGEKIRLTEEFRQKAQEVAELENRSLVAEKLFPKLAPAQAELRALGDELGSVTQKIATIAEGNKQLAASSDAARVSTANQAAATAAQAEAQAELDREFDRAEREFEALDKAHAKHEKGLARVSKGTKAAAVATTDYAGAVRRLIDQYLPTEAAALRLAETQQLLNEAVAAGAVSQEKATEIMSAMQAEMNATAREAEETANGFRDAWQDGVRQLDQTFQGLWRGLVTGQGDALADLESMLLEWLADLSYQLLLSPLIIPIQTALMGGTGGTGGVSGLSGLSGWFDSTSMGESYAKMFDQAYLAFGSPESLANATAWGDAMTSLSQVPNWAFAAGGIGGSLLGNALFGDKGYGAIGSTLGSTVGSIVGGMYSSAIAAALGIAIPGIGAIIGGLLGGVGGGFLGSLFGGNQEPRIGQYAAQSGGHNSLEDWQQGPSAYSQGAFGLTFGLNDLGTKYFDAAELKEAYDILAQATEELADFFGPELSKLIEEQLAAWADPRGLIQLASGEGDLGQALAALVETIAAAAGATGEELGIAFGAMVGDLSGSVEEVAKQIQQAMQGALLAMELSARYATDLGKMLNLTGDIGTDMALLTGYINEFRAAGETNAETLARMVAQLGVLKLAAEQTTTAIDDLSTEALLDLSDALIAAFDSLEEATAAITFYYEEFTTSTQQMVDAVEAAAAEIESGLSTAIDTEALQAQIDEYLAFADLYAQTIATTPGLTLEEIAALTAEMQLYLDAAADIQAVIDAFATLDELPDTRDEFDALIQGIDLTTTAGQELYAALMELAPAFDLLYDNAEAFTDWLLGVDEYEQAMRELEAVFSDWGMTVPATRDELLALYAAGTFTVEQLAILGAMTNELGIIYGDLASAVIDYTALNIRLAEAQGNDALALQLQREQELANAADDYSRSLLLQIYAYEDATAAAEAAYQEQYRQWEETEKARRAAYNAEVEAIRASNTAAQQAADEANRAAREALQALQTAAEEAYRVATDIANAWLEALSAVGLGAEATALQRRLQAASMDSALSAVYGQVWAIQDRATLAGGQADLAIQALNYLGRDDDARAAERRLLQAGTAPELRGLQAWVFGLEDAQKAAKEAAEGLKELITGLEQASAAIGAALERIDALIMAPAAMQAQRRADAQAQITAALAAARAGTMPAAADLERPLTTLTEDPVNLFADRIAYQRDLGRTRGQLAALQGLVDAQIPIEEQALAALKDLPNALYPGFEAIVGAIGTTQEDTATLLRQATIAIDNAIAAMRARDEALAQSITEIVPEIKEIPPYIETIPPAIEPITPAIKEIPPAIEEIPPAIAEIPPQLIPLQTLANDIVTNMAAIDLNVDGQVTYDEFAGFFGQLMNADDLAKYFDLLDTNNDGIIDELELITANTNPLVTMVDNLVSKFSTIDLNVDGMVSYSEFAAFFDGLASDDEMQSWFNTLDVNNDGLISELEAVNASLQPLQSLALTIAREISKIDLNINGQVEYAEFANFFAGLASDAEMKAWFDRLDLDQNGILSLQDLTNAKLTLSNTNDSSMINYLLSVVNKLTTENTNSAAQITKLNEAIAKLQTQINALTTANTKYDTQISHLSWLGTLKQIAAADQQTLGDIRWYNDYQWRRLDSINYGITTNTSGTLLGASTASAKNLVYVSQYGAGTGLFWGYATGGIAEGPTSGYGVTLHGREAIIPLGDGNSITAHLKAPLPPTPNYIAREAGDSLALRQALAELQAEVAALRSDQQTIGAATVGELKDHNRRERKREVVGQKVEVLS